jgi:hypothetical protein
MAAAVPFMLAASTAISVIGAITQGEAASDSAAYNSKVAANNAKAAMDQANLDAARQRQHAAQVFGNIRASYGASGVTMEGSPLDVLAASATQAELDNQIILYGGKVRSAAFMGESSLESSRASNAETSGYMNAASSLLLGGARTYDAFGNQNRGLTRTGGSFTGTNRTL